MIWILVAVIIVAIFVFFLLFIKKQIEEQMKSKFAELSKDALKDNNEQFLTLANTKLESKQKEIQQDFDARKALIEQSIKGLKDELERYRKIIGELEKDRAAKYGSLETQIKDAASATEKLRSTTDNLSNILGNVTQRGQWGERMAEDIIKGCGLAEGLNYKKRTKQDSAATIPDYTFLLPDKHKINMDVKFSLNNYLLMVNATDNNQKESYKKEFLNNVKARIKEIQNREYINPADNTLDFVLLFIPNEQVYGFIQESLPGLIDEAMKQKVVLCSPFTLYAMLSVIRQAFENFHYEKATHEIIKMIDLFDRTYEIFKGRFEEIGKSIEKLEHLYSDVKETSFKQLDTKIKKIHDYKKGHIPILEDNSNSAIDVSGEEIGS